MEAYVTKAHSNWLGVARVAGRLVSPSLTKSSTDLRGYLLRNALHRLPYQHLDHGIHATCLLVQGNLAISACSSRVFEQTAQVIHLVATAQIHCDVIHDIEQFADGLSHAEAAALYEIEYVRVQTGVHDAPLVLFDKVTR